MFGTKVDAEIRKHALACYPHECCGVVLGGGIYVKMDNVHEDPINSFRMSDSQVIPLLASGRVRAIVHSHVNIDPYPSKYDMEKQIETGVPWGIITVFPDKRTEGPFCWTARAGAD